MEVEGSSGTGTSADDATPGRRASPGLASPPQDGHWRAPYRQRMMKTSTSSTSSRRSTPNTFHRFRVLLECLLLSLVRPQPPLSGCGKLRIRRNQASPRRAHLARCRQRRAGPSAACGLRGMRPYGVVEGGHPPTTRHGKEAPLAGH